MTDFEVLVAMTIIIIASVCVAKAAHWLAHRRPRRDEPHEHLPDNWDAPRRRVAD